MSRSLKIISITLLGFTIGATLMWTKEKFNRTPNRKYASMDGQKLKMLNGKTLANLQVRISAPENLPNDDDKETTLSGYILVQNQRDEDLQYEWELPNGVEVVSGHTSDSLPGILKNQLAKVDLTVRGFSSQTLKLVTFRAYYNSVDGMFGNTAVISSRPQDSFEFIAPVANGESGIDPRPKIQK